MKKIHKKYLKEVGKQSFLLPYNSEIVKIGEQQGVLCVWYMFDEKDIENCVKRVLNIYGTGHEISPDDRYLETVIRTNGLVWHVFEG